MYEVIPALQHGSPPCRFRPRSWLVRCWQRTTIDKSALRPSGSGHQNSNDRYGAPSWPSANCGDAAGSIHLSHSTMTLRCGRSSPAGDARNHPLRRVFEAGAIGRSDGRLFVQSPPAFALAVPAWLNLHTSGERLKLDAIRLLDRNRDMAGLAGLAILNDTRFARMCTGNHHAIVAISSK